MLAYCETATCRCARPIVHGKNLLVGDRRRDELLGIDGGSLAVALSTEQRMICIASTNFKQILFCKSQGELSFALRVDDVRVDDSG